MNQNILKRRSYSKTMMVLQCYISVWFCYPLKIWWAYERLVKGKNWVLSNKLGLSDNIVDAKDAIKRSAVLSERGRLEQSTRTSSVSLIKVTKNFKQGILFYRRVHCFSEQAKEDFVIYLMSKIAFIWILLFSKEYGRKCACISYERVLLRLDGVAFWTMFFFVCKMMILWRGKLTKHASIGIHIHMRLIVNSCQRCRQGLTIKTCTLHEDKIMRKYFEGFFGEADFWLLQ
jgi:hypothetical protein